MTANPKKLPKETKAISAQSTSMSDFARTFEAFKGANDERLAQIEAKSQADALTEAKVSRIDAALEAQSKRIERLALSQSQPTLGGGAVNTEAKSAWSNYIRSGDVSALKALEGKAASTADNEGGYVAPIESESMIDRALENASPFRMIAGVRRVGAGYFRKPVSPGGAAAGWAGETDVRTETTAPALDLIEFPAGELYAMPAATQTLLDDGVADVDQWLADEVRDVFANQETAAFITGDGVNKPRGLLSYDQQDNASHSWGNIGTISTGVDGDFDDVAPVDALLDLVYAPETKYRTNASFVMNRRTVSAIRKFKDADGNYIWQPATEAGAPSTLLGYKLVEVEDMPDISSGATLIAFGDFRRGYLIVDRQGVRVLRDPYSAKPYVLFYTTKRIGGGVQDFNAIKLLKFAA
jgi:HK97 family phage major capsid protein